MELKQFLDDVFSSSEYIAVTVQYKKTSAVVITKDRNGLIVRHNFGRFGGIHALRLIHSIQETQP